MKRRIIALALTCLAATGLCAPAAASGAEQESSITVSEDIGDMTLHANSGGHYVNGNGMLHSPGKSYLFANEKGGLTLVQQNSERVGGVWTYFLTVAEFDAEYHFLNTRSIPLEGMYKWGGFCAGEDYNYAVYATERATMRIDQYSKDWTLVGSRSYTPGNTTSLFDNDFDIAAGGGYLFVATNHIMSGGHQANLRMQINAENLALVVEHSSIAGYVGYCSHSYMPEIVYSGGSLYAFDRSEKIPGAGLFLTRYGAGLASAYSQSSIKSMAFADWGSLGNAAPVSGGAVAVYNYALNSAGNTATDVYLYYTGGATQRITYTGEMGTPWVAPLNGSAGFVLCNPDLRSHLPEDDLYYAAYTVSGGSLAVGSARKVSGHYLSDCEPIAFRDELVWFTVENGEVVFHRLSGQTGMSKTIAHNWGSVAGRAPTCALEGLTDGVSCVNCGEIQVAQEEIEKLPHAEEILPGREPTCALAGLTQGARCSVCEEILTAQEVIDPLPHTEEILPGTEATCTAYGWTEGKKCSVCGRTTVAQELIDKAPHAEEVYPGYASTCIREGLTDGKKCAVCGRITQRGESIPKGEHDPVDTPEIPPTATCVGTTAGTACSYCGKQLTGGEDIPELMFTIQSQRVENGRLSLDFELIDNVYMLVIAFYDADGAITGIDLAHERWDWQRVNTVEFDLPEDSVSYRVFALDTYYSYLQPACEARGGEI